jgi:ADP-ribosylglycohydrolase
VDWFRLYPQAGYGGTFARWCLAGGGDPYQSWGNGSAMRVSPVAWAYGDLETVLEKARESAVVTHSHAEGVKGAQAVAAAIFLARQGESKEAIRSALRERFGYPLDRTLEEIRPGYRFDVSCQGSVPESLVAFLEADGVEGAIRNAISLGGDADTMACIAGSVAEAFYGEVPRGLVEGVWQRIDAPMKGIVRDFYRRYRPDSSSLPED